MSLLRIQVPSHHCDNFIAKLANLKSRCYAFLTMTYIQFYIIYHSASMVLFKIISRIDFRNSVYCSTSADIDLKGFNLFVGEGSRSVL